MNWERLKSFYQVARAGSFTNAAIQLNISQSALSRTVMQLEHEVRTPLFYRLPHGLELTEQGKALYSVTSKMFYDAQSVEFLFNRDKNDAEGVLRITSTIALSSLWLPYYANNFLESYPDMRLQIEANDDELDLNVRRADVSIRTLIPHQTELIQDYLVTFHPRIYASPKYLEKYGEPKNVEDLDNHRLITYNDNRLHPYGNMNWILHVGTKTGKPRRSFLRINLGPGLIKMAEQGVGIIAISDQYPAVADSALVPILTDLEGPGTKIYYSYPKQMKGYRRIEVFGDYLKEALASRREKC